MPRTQLIDRLVINKTVNNAIIRLNQITFNCLIGHAGIGQKSREGDGLTPVGRWKLVYFLYRSDRISKPRSQLPGFAIKQQDSWNDRSGSRNYNLPLAITLPNSSESLWRADHLYDIVVILNHNSRPAIPGRGSAIFMHLHGPDSNYTHGCIALNQPDLLKVLGCCGPKTDIIIKA